MNYSASEVYDLAIVGAGPAGAMAAYAAAKRGLKVILLDANEFPRDKVCGDAIPYETYKLLQKLEPEWEKELLQHSSNQLIRRARIHTPNGKNVTVEWSLKAVNSARYDFDYWLLKKVLDSNTLITDFNFRLKGMEREKGEWVLSSSSKQIKSKWLVGAGGAHCPVARQLSEKRTDRKHHCGALRAYFENIEDLNPIVNEVYVLKEFVPGYLWIFPLPNGGANVGFGMLSSEIIKRDIDLKQAFEKALASKELKNRFQNAIRKGKVKGFDLPLGSKTPIISGEGYFLAGDAASLIDPLDGHGIGAAMWSGYEAVHRIADIVFDGKSESQAAKEYHKELDLRFYKKFRLHRKLLYFSSLSFLLNAISIPILMRLAGFNTVSDTD